MTMQRQPGSPSSGPTSQPPRWIRVGLTIALVVAVVAGILFFRSLGPLNKNYGVLGGAEAISLVAIIFLMTFGGSPWRTVIAALACVAAVIPSCEGLVFTYLPLAGPSMVDQAHPSPLGQKESLIILLAANISVIVLAILYGKGSRIMLLLYVVLGLVGGGTLLRWIYN